MCVCMCARADVNVRANVYDVHCVNSCVTNFSTRPARNVTVSPPGMHTSVSVVQLHQIHIEPL